MILRLLYDDTGLDSLEQLGYLPEQNALFDRMMRMPYGINILSGPTGSGKSMTLKVTLEGLDKLHGGSKHILTIEDPPEYRIRGEGINQTPLVYDATDPDAERQAWAAGIANGMRLDPDYMMIGEVRDLFAAVAAFRGAMTGHGLWSTLHTNSAIGIVQRLKDLGVDPGLLFDPALLTGLINQSLLPKLCPHCKVRFQDHQDQLAPDLVERVRRLTDVSQVHVKGPGCQACRGSGVNGRSIVAEVVLPTLAFMRVFAKAAQPRHATTGSRPCRASPSTPTPSAASTRACSTRRWSRISLGHSTSMSICSTTASTRRRRADGGLLGAVAVRLLQQAVRPQGTPAVLRKHVHPARKRGPVEGCCGRGAQDLRS
ncbi:ATPase, T2SS/T4P/T4SS family [Pseudomonas aeruginosa]|nr:ATPase, T2SS/T4P/T4SS family [Pseudomonas aeruginosa]